ncbi:MAG TPA: copper-binding protein [Blastocatellia bacterium]|nr:copper-binding protein [Blastocatellia bacterium]
MIYDKPLNRIIRIAATLVVAAVTAALAACGSGDANAQRYELKGKVEHVDKRGSAVTIAHEEIKGYMPAMTMPFKLKDESIYDELAPGDKVTATLVIAGNRSWLEDVIRSRAIPDAAGAPPTASAGPAEGTSVPDFTLTNQDGRPIRMSKYRGKAILLTFIYTRCPLPDYCPLMTERFAELENRLKTDAALYGRTRLLSITVDPEYDKPAVLRSYGQGAGAGSFDHWEFATGSAEEVKKVATWFGLEYWPDKDQIIHSLRTAVIAPDRKLAKLYHGSDWKTDDLMNDLRSLPAPEAPAVKIAEKLAKSATGMHRGVGVVESIDKEMGQVQIDHEEIKDFMPAMNMPFPVKDKALLDAVAPGDRVEFLLRADESGMVVVAIKKRKP